MGREREPRARLAAWGAIPLLVALVASACSQGSDGKATSDRASPAIVSPDAGTASPGLPYDPGLGTPAEAEAGKITIVLQEASFGEGEPILAEVRNGLDETVYASDSKTDCSIVILERLTAIGDSNVDVWEPVEGCLLGRPPAPVGIGSQHGREVRIDPASMNFATDAGGADPRLSAGRFRLAFTYGFESNPDGNEPEVAYSDPFEVSG